MKQAANRDKDIGKGINTEMVAGNVTGKVKVHINPSICKKTGAWPDEK